MDRAAHRRRHAGPIVTLLPLALALFLPAAVLVPTWSRPPQPRIP